jgi:cyclophilin family peptidyl-prolyl cis-trans isomerase
MSTKKNSIRKRSRPVETESTIKKFKKNKPAMLLTVFIVLMMVLGSFYVIFSGNTDTDSEEIKSYQEDPDYLAAIAETDYPVAVLETSKGAIAIELYNDMAPKTCENFITLVNDGFYDGMIFHRVMDDFMIQAGNTYPDGTTKESSYGSIEEFEDALGHVDGSISMASTGAGVPGSAQFFICDGEQSGLDGNYASFGKTIYGMDVVRDIADEPHDESYGSVGGGRPDSDIIINKIQIVNE